MAKMALREIVPNTSHFTPESIISAAEEAGLDIRLFAASEYALISDSAKLRKLLANANPAEDIILVTDLSFRPGGSPFAFSASQSESFAEEYLKSFRENVVSGADVVIICRDTKLIVLYHHEGHIAFVTP